MSAPTTENKAAALPAEIVALQPQIAALCQQYGVLRLSLFGSRARGDARPDSDYDFVVKFGSHPSMTMLHQYMDFYHDLKTLLNREVHLMDDKPIRNIYLRESVAAHQILLYDKAA